MHWQTSPAVFKDLLKKQNKFLNTVNVITIEGLVMEALETKINMNQEEKTLQAYMCENDILQIKQSINAYALGKWFLIFYKKYNVAVNILLNYSIPQIRES
eukprot:13993912-Ditylum_brightwellii.AAC.1